MNERCKEAHRIQRIDDAFRAGSLEDLRQAVDDPSVIPNGQMPDAIGQCLVYAIYHSPLTFIRTLLEIGANPNAPVDDGFPPIIAALSTARAAPGTTPRTDVDEVVRLLLAHGADPNQRGINDYTGLHMAVAERSHEVVQVLLDGGADPDLPTRIDACEAPLQMAESAGLTEIAATLARRGRPLGRRLRSGLTLLVDIPGEGDEVRRQQRYRVRLRMRLADGSPVRWLTPSGPVGAARLEDSGETLFTEIRVDRSSLANGVFYSLDGMRVGGTRRTEIAPHMAYGDRGVPGVVPPGAVITAEIKVLASAS